MQSRKIICLIIASSFLVLTVSSVFTSVYAEDDDLKSRRLRERYSQNSEFLTSNDSIPYYLEYYALEKQKGHIDSSEDITVDIGAGITNNGPVSVFSDGFFYWDEEETEWAEFDFRVTQNGFYNLEITYISVDGGTDAPRRSVKFDDKVLFSEMNNMVFDRKWAYSEKPGKDIFGNEIRPRQTEIMDANTFRMIDSLGRYVEPLRFYLDSGSHTLRITAVKESVTICGIRLVAPESVPSYSQTVLHNQNRQYPKSQNSIRIDAEYPAHKSSISVRMETSSDPKADPSAIDGIVFNSIGGPNWCEGNSTISWEFNVPESGLYKIAIRAYQKYNDGLSSYRQIMIDGKVPFEEFLCYEFKQKNWETIIPGMSADEPYLIWLEKGDHTISMSVKTAPYLETLIDLEKTLEAYSLIIQDIIKITGIQPDINFDYRLDRQIPDLVDSLNEISEGLSRQIGNLQSSANTRTSTVSSLEQIKYRVDKMIDDPFVIAGMLENMISDLTTLSVWISGFNNLALMIDYIDILSPDAAAENTKSTVFERVWYVFKQFILSFKNDYSKLDENDKDGRESLDIWISRGKEWAEALKQIIDDEYVNDRVYPNLNMLPAGQAGVSGVVLLALASGTQPDLVIGTDQITPVEFGMREAIADISRFSDYDEIAERFAPGAMTPYRFKDKAYALPETMDFTIMYYREDIMNSLGLIIPDTWEEMTTIILPELKRQGMDFWYEGGLYSFLFQNGGEIYTEDGLASALNSMEGMNAFKQFTDLYQIYKIPVAASFFNRFRAGQMPIGISSFVTYLQISAAAPELEGKWRVLVIPGIKDSSGKINRSTIITTTSTMMFKNDEDKSMEENGWEFMKWYTSADIQERYANDLQAYIGSSAKWFSANTEAFDSLSWNNELGSVIREQRGSLKGIPNVVGGYITARHIENARVRTVVGGMNFRESIEKAAEDITRELIIKNSRFDMRKEMIEKEGE